MQGREPEGGSFVYESFTRVSPRKKRRRNAQKDSSLPFNLVVRATEAIAADGGWLLHCEELFQLALREVRIRPQDILCLGLGSPCASRDARAQLAFLGRLSAVSNIEAANVFVYDPVFTDTDRQLLQGLGMQGLVGNEACISADDVNHSLDRPTILYMPHCDLKLYEIVLRANWTYERLSGLMFVANCFSDYIDNNPASKLERESPCLMRIGKDDLVGERVSLLIPRCLPTAPFVHSRPLPTSRPFPTAFSNLSVQYVRGTPLSLESDAFWDVLPLQPSCERDMC
ncbi:SRR1-domain-containing protein [Phlebopus sp. FC_14]|nr:SRR1-domain-containing protein [Phlebopus sp. FC_14]